MPRTGWGGYCAWTALLLAAMLFSGTVGASLAGAEESAKYEESEVYLAVDSFVWREFDDDGSRLLKESGPLFGLGFIYMHESEDHVTLKPAAEIFGGTVDYDGQACEINTITHTITCQPATSKVDYLGLKLEGDVGRRYRPGEEVNYFIEPFGGVGLRAWNRNIRDGTAADGTATAGYLERWLTLYFRLGLRGGVDFSRKTQAFAEAGMKLPIYNQNTAYQSSIGGQDYTFHPGRQASLFSEVGLKMDRLKASLFYDSLRFSRSEVIDIGGGIGVLQPKSTMDIYGVRLGVIF